jgi:hypothetical protein
MGYETYQPERPGWVVELWHRPRHGRSIELLIYWHGPDDAYSASSLGPSAAVFHDEQSAVTAFQIACVRPPMGASKWGAVTTDQAKSRRSLGRRVISWGGATSMPEISGD